MLPLALLAVCLGAALSAPALDPQLDEHWNLWKGWHSKKYHEVTIYRELLRLWVSSCGNKGQSLICVVVVERGGLEENDLGEEPEEDRAAQPGALDGRTLLPPGHEPLWRHGEVPE